MQNNSFGKNIIRGFKERINKWTDNPFREVNLNAVKLVYYKHLNPGTIRSHQLFGKTVYFSSATEFVAGLKEIFIDKIYAQRLPDRPYIIDCGANIGLSVIYMKKQYPGAEIIAFEPDEENFNLLQTNIKSFNYENVQARKEAVWVENTMLQFASEGSMSSRINTEISENTVPVKAIKLKDYLDRTVDFLKIDIEGAEFQVIMDITEQLQHVNNLFLEYHGSFYQNNELNQIFSLLVDKGFSYYVKEATSVYDHPFIRQKKERINYDIQLNIFCFRVKVPN